MSDNCVISDNCLYPNVAGILAGIAKGKIWRFCKDGTEFSVVYSHCVGGCGLVGSIPQGMETEIRAFLEGVFAELAADGFDDFEFSAEDETLYSRMFTLFPEKEFDSEREFSYRLKRTYDDLCPRLGEFELRRTDNALINELLGGKYENAELILDPYVNSWENAEQFLKYSAAVVATCGNEVAGMIIGSSRYGDVVAIDIEVDEKYRRRGLAYEMSRHMLDICAKANLTVQWDHTESNDASRELAKKLGFALMRERRYYWFSI